MLRNGEKDGMLESLRPLLELVLYPPDIILNNTSSMEVEAPDLLAVKEAPYQQALCQALRNGEKDGMLESLRPLLELVLYPPDIILNNTSSMEVEAPDLLAVKEAPHQQASPPRKLPLS